MKKALKKSKARKNKPSPKPKARKAKVSSRPAAKVKEKVLFDIPHYPQSEEFTSSAACAMMVLKYVNPNFKMKKEQEYSIWQEAVNGSVWHGSKYGLAYALAKRGAVVSIVSNTKDEGYDKKLAVYENVNLDTLTASYNEIKQKSIDMNIVEEHNTGASINLVKRTLSTNKIPIVLIDANAINPYLESSPHWVVVKGYDKDAFYINDPYSDSTITLDHEAFKSALGFDSNFHIIVTSAKRSTSSDKSKD